MSKDKIKEANKYKVAVTIFCNDCRRTQVKVYSFDREKVGLNRSNLKDMERMECSNCMSDKIEVIDAR